MKNVLITGSSSGLGLSLAEAFLKSGYNVFGISRSTTPLDIFQIQCDFSNLKALELAIEPLKKISHWDYVVLIAGTLGKLEKQQDLTIGDYSAVLNINTFSNKIILDSLLNVSPINNVIGISSGAALKTYFGWSLYCLSKAAFKQLVSSYADEFPKTHFLSLAPGIIKSKMQEIIYNEDEKRIPSVKKFHEMYDKMVKPEKVANNIVQKLPTFRDFSSGSFVDMRDILK